MITATAFDWLNSAACAGADLTVFFGPDSETETAKARREAKAKAVCAGCPVRLRCLQWALTSGTQQHGVFGGTGEDERATARRLQLRRAAKARKAVA